MKQVKFKFNLKIKNFQKKNIAYRAFKYGMSINKEIIDFSNEPGKLKKNHTLNFV